MNTLLKPAGDQREELKPFHVFSYRCPRRLIGPLDDARYMLRVPSRTALVTRAIEEFLQRRGITVPAA